jgi:hypothetical protein
MSGNFAGAYGQIVTRVNHVAQSFIPAPHNLN